MEQRGSPCREVFCRRSPTCPVCPSSVAILTKINGPAKERFGPDSLPNDYPLSPALFLILSDKNQREDAQQSTGT